jgi:hypothetical protein
VGVRVVNVDFSAAEWGGPRLIRGPTNACVEIVFVGIRLCDRLNCASLSAYVDGRA